MKRFPWILLAIILVSSLVLSGCASPPTPAAPPETSAPPPTTPAPAPAAPPSAAPSAAAAKPVVLKFAYDFPPVGAVTAGWNWFASELETQTAGKYKIEFYPSQTLVKSSETLNALHAGITDIVSCQLTSQQQAFPVNAVVSLPSVPFPDTPAGHLAARQTARQLVDEFPAVANEFSKVKVLFRHPLPAFILISKKTNITVPDDIKGLKIGAEGFNKEIAKEFGGSPVNMFVVEIYQSMEKGVVDGAMIGWFHITPLHFEEVARYFLDYPLAQLPQSALMNLNTWNSIPPDVQKIITSLTAEAESRSTDAYMVQIEKGKQIVRDKGGTIIVPTAEQRKLWSARVQALDNIWLDDMKAKGITDAQAILNFVKQRCTEAWSKN